MIEKKQFSPQNAIIRKRLIRSIKRFYSYIRKSVQISLETLKDNKTPKKKASEFLSYKVFEGFWETLTCQQGGADCRKTALLLISVLAQIYPSLVQQFYPRLIRKIYKTKRLSSNRIVLGLHQDCPSAFDLYSSLFIEGASINQKVQSENDPPLFLYLQKNQVGKKVQVYPLSSLKNIFATLSLDDVPDPSSTFIWLEDNYSECVQTKNGDMLHQAAPLFSTDDMESSTHNQAIYDSGIRSRNWILNKKSGKVVESLRKMSAPLKQGRRHQAIISSSPLARRSPGRRTKGNLSKKLSSSLSRTKPVSRMDSTLNFKRAVALDQCRRKNDFSIKQTGLFSKHDILDKEKEMVFSIEDLGKSTKNHKLRSGKQKLNFFIKRNRKIPSPYQLNFV